MKDNKKTSRTSRTSKTANTGKNIVIGLIAIVAFLAMACGFFYANDRSKKDIGETKTTTATTDKKEKSTKEISLEHESTEAQRIVDSILLKKNNWQLKEDKHGLKSLNIPGSEYKVKINQRDLNVGLPVTTTLSAAGDWIKERVEEKGLVYLGGESCNYKAWDGYRARIGIKTKAGEGSKSFLTDTIVFFHNSNLEKEDKDVKEKTIRPVPTRKYKGKVAILVDDCGYNNDALKKMLDTNLPFSYAILPNKDFSSDALHLIKGKNRVALLHLPMQASGNAKEEGTTIHTFDDPKEQTAKTKKLLATLPGVMGVNNHQGSAATSDRDTMEQVLKELKAQGMFFIDSNTSSQSIARDTARRMNVPTARNDIFLDNEADVEYIRKKIYEAFARAERNGSVIAICHARPATAACWEKYAAEFKAAGVEFVPVTSLLY